MPLDLIVWGALGVIGFGRHAYLYYKYKRLINQDLKLAPGEIGDGFKIQDLTKLYQYSYDKKISLRGDPLKTPITTSLSRLPVILNKPFGGNTFYEYFNCSDGKTICRMREITPTFHESELCFYYHINSINQFTDARLLVKGDDFLTLIALYKIYDNLKLECIYNSHPDLEAQIMERVNKLRELEAEVEL